MKKVAQFVNMTPHPVVIVDEAGNVLETYPASGSLIRLAAVTKRIGKINNTPISLTSFGKVEGLPDEEEGVFYIVSQLVKSALPERNDLYVPAEVLRDEKGQIIGARSLGL